MVGRAALMATCTMICMGRQPHKPNNADRYVLASQKRELQKAYERAPHHVCSPPSHPVGVLLAFCMPAAQPKVVQRCKISCQLTEIGAPLAWKALPKSLHGGRRVAHSFRIVASAKTSTFSSQCAPANCSGAMYWGVPCTFVVDRNVFAGSWAGRCHVRAGHLPLQSTHCTGCAGMQQNLLGCLLVSYARL